MLTRATGNIPEYDTRPSTHSEREHTHQREGLRIAQTLLSSLRTEAEAEKEEKEDCEIALEL